jgi:hypothetical protein
MPDEWLQGCRRIWGTSPIQASVWNMGTSRLDGNAGLQVAESMRSREQMRGTGADQPVVAKKGRKRSGAKGLSRSVFKTQQPQGRIL